MACGHRHSPNGLGESFSAHVARILDVIDKNGVPYQLTPMVTILEGEWEDVMGVDCARIGMSLKVDYGAGRSRACAARSKSSKHAWAANSAHVNPARHAAAL